MSTIKVILVDDHKIIREGIASLLSYVDDIEVIANCEDGLSAVEKVKELNPDVILMDINMPKMNGIEATAKIKESNTKTKVLVLTVHEELAYITKILDAGALGYVLKTTDKEELVMAIKSLHQGKQYFTPEVANTMLSGYIKKENNANTEELSLREIEVLVLIASEYTNKEIADRLCVSDRTVDAHRRSLLKKTGARNTAGLVTYAIKHNFMDEL